MRRKDLEITGMGEIMSIVRKCEVCRLGLADNNEPYVVPMNYGYELNGERLTLYFHCAKEGRKLEILRRNPRVCFEIDCGHTLVTGEDACDYSYKYESVIGNGNAVFLEEHGEKNRALQKLMEHYAGHGGFSFTEKETAMVTVFKIEADSYTAKHH